MAESSISLLFNQLSVLLREEHKLLGGLKDEAEYIRCEIGQMRAFLRVADAKEESDPQLKEWVRQVREIAYDTEDVLERYMLRFPHHDTHGFSEYLKTFYVLMKNLKARHQLAREIQTIISRVDNASKSQQTYKDIYTIMLQSSSSTANTNTWYDGRGDALQLEETEVVGIEKPKKQLLQWLSYSDYELKVISVVGMAGLDKTTLVKQPPPQGLKDMNADSNATCSENNGHVYSLEPLPKQESKELFCRKAFSGKSCPLYLEQICSSILKRCEGLPLAIVVIGGLLATKNNRIEEWEMFNRGLGLELKGDNLKRFSKLLSLSFYDLPYYLKACFLYLSIFPEDHYLEKATVIRLWVAEGFVEAKQGKTMEEIAEGYLNELFNRSLIQVAETSRDGRPRNFHIHDLILEYIVSKSREQNMVLQSGCRFLKVLDLRRAPLNVIPNEVFQLYLLEYLSLRDTEVKLIPKSIGNLRKLEILDLKRSRVTELPIEILKRERFRNLLVYRYTFTGYHQFDTIKSFKASYEIGKLLSLQKLCYIDVGEEINGMKLVREIGKLTMLRRLCISNLRREDGEEFCSSLAKLTNLRSLGVGSVGGELMDLQYSLNLPFLRTLELMGCLERVPQWISSLSALTRLCLRWSKLHNGYGWIAMGESGEGVHAPT
ncbi:hypothetical protein BUALT_Bualt03G0213000 [Buddleja alternifolia]|uniref:Uncharacterized protein n=1 Tax=Buddleja alternifolia TaxID=168488 RepID=A0AAV6Y6D8_9LAMI|nr:hypothetical protein BUALT_Bualt03G0213000 [Buddleja alternifolia]